MTEIDKKAKRTIIWSLVDSVIKEVTKEPTIGEYIYEKVCCQQIVYQEKNVHTKHGGRLIS